MQGNKTSVNPCDFENRIFPKGKRDLTLCFILDMIKKNSLEIFIYFFNFNFPDFTEHLLASLPLSILYINIFPPSFEMLQATSTISRCGSSIFLSSCQKQIKFFQHTLGSRTNCNSLQILKHKVNIQFCYFTDCNLAVSLTA